MISVTFAPSIQALNRGGVFATLLQNNPIEIAEQYEMTHFDGDAPLGQSETKDGVGIDRRAKGDGDPEFITLARRLPVSSLRRLIPVNYKLSTIMHFGHSKMQHQPC